jgi:hypothetical protein
VDLRPITRESDRYQTVVRIYRDGFRHKRWIVLGQAALERRGDGFDKPLRWDFEAYLTEGVTDFEHDSARAIRIPLIAVEFKHVWYGHAEFNAVIDPMNGRGFHVPPPGYNPMELPETRQCTHPECKDEPHLVVPEGHYVPPTNEELFKKVAGRYVQIIFGVPRKEEP